LTLSARYQGLIRLAIAKNIQPIAERVALAENDQLHNFVAAGVSDAAPVVTERSFKRTGRRAESNGLIFRWRPIWRGISGQNRLRLP
jgi:hypothetical protein